MATTSKRPPQEKHTKDSRTNPATAATSQPTNGNSLAAEPDNRHNDLRNLYSAILRYRSTERQVRLSLQQSMGRHGEGQFRFHGAVAVGATFQLRPSDTVVASRGNMAVQISLGRSLKELTDGAVSCGGDAAEKLAVPPESLELLNFATGMALAHKLDKKGNVVVAFSDDDLRSLTRSHEALKTAGKHRLPIVLVLQSEWVNPAAGSKDSAMQDISFLAKEYGFPGILVDGDDASAIWRVAQESIHRARLGTGPTLLECKTGVSSEDSLAHLERYMRKRGSWDAGWRRDVGHEIEADLEKVAAVADRSARQTAGTAAVKACRP
jgi:TPP-dependent pyruvate/acetoin dehydrogenase alpha subunit